jgi:hypothetical protein
MLALASFAGYNGSTEKKSDSVANSVAKNKGTLINVVGKVRYRRE